MVEETPSPLQAHIACEAEGCTNAASARPIVVLIRPTPFPPLEVPLHLLVCAEHQSGTTMDSIFNEDGWRHLSVSFAVAGQPRPIRELSSLRWALLT